MTHTNFYLNNSYERNKLLPLDKLQERLDFFNLIFNNIHNGVLITDAKGVITFMNEPYGRFLGLDSKKQVGRHTTDVIENTRMHIVAQTGEPEINLSQRIKGQSMVVQRIPIKKNGKVIAVFGQVMFKDVKDVSILANKLSRLQDKVKEYERELCSLRSTRYTLESISGVSQIMQRLKQEALQAANNDLPVLITGESGTGKELFAQAIHQASLRDNKAFVRINCAAIAKDLFETEFFGYAKGAYTGALSKGKPGKFEMADKGTVFLDEIGELPLEMQPKLLRVLEEKELERVGGTKIIKTDFRLIAATNQNLEEMLKKGLFRRDLFYRLNVIPINIPPLRKRTEDVIPLANHLLGRICRKNVGDRRYLSKGAQKVLTSHAWPGNGRELLNVLERSLAMLQGDLIQSCDLPYYLTLSSASEPNDQEMTLKESVARAERRAINLALKKAGNNKTEAANILGVHRTLLYKKMKKYQLDYKVKQA